jgi:hypothetical protein
VQNSRASGNRPLQKEKRMNNQPNYEMLAQAFANEGVDTLFNLMGDGNMARGHGVM